MSERKSFSRRLNNCAFGRPSAGPSWQQGQNSWLARKEVAKNVNNEIITNCIRQANCAAPETIVAKTRAARLCASPRRAAPLSLARPRRRADSLRGKGDASRAPVIIIRRTGSLPLSLIDCTAGERASERARASCRPSARPVASWALASCCARRLKSQRLSRATSHASRGKAAPPPPPCQ